MSTNAIPRHLLSDEAYEDTVAYEEWQDEMERLEREEDAYWRQRPEPAHRRDDVALACLAVITIAWTVAMTALTAWALGGTS
jgi:hypothetical protein